MIDVNDLRRRTYVRSVFGEGWVQPIRFPTGEYLMKTVDGGKRRVSPSDISAVWDAKSKVWVVVKRSRRNDMDVTAVARELIGAAKLLARQETFFQALEETMRGMKVSLSLPDGSRKMYLPRFGWGTRFDSVSPRGFVDKFQFLSPDQNKSFEEHSTYRVKVIYDMAGGHLNKTLDLVLRTFDSPDSDLVEFVGDTVPKAIETDVRRNWKELNEAVESIGQGLAEYYRKPGYKGD